MESAMPRPRYRQDPLPIGPNAPPSGAVWPRAAQSAWVGADAAGAAGSGPLGAVVREGPAGRR